MQNAYLSGASVYLRPLEKSDAAFLASALNNSQVTRTLATIGPINVASEEQWLSTVNQSPGDLVLGIALRAGERLIGACGLHRIDYRNRHAELGIVIGDPSEWGKGYGTEAVRLLVGHAFETLNLNRVQLHVYETNPAGIRAYEKVGFRREGVMRQFAFREGRYWDAHLMAILREQWTGVSRETDRPR